MPVVQIERGQTRDTHAVLVDNRAGTASAMQHLLELGHRRIAFIGGDPTRYPRSLSRGCSVEEERLESYAGTLREAGASVDERLIQLGEYVAPLEDGSNLAGYRGMKTILELPPRPTAVFAGCDILAAGALQAIYEARLRISDDISLVGYDDTLAFASRPVSRRSLNRWQTSDGRRFGLLFPRSLIRKLERVALGSNRGGIPESARF